MKCVNCQSEKVYAWAKIEGYALVDMTTNQIEDKDIQTEAEEYICQDCNNKF